MDAENIKRQSADRKLVSSPLRRFEGLPRGIDGELEGGFSRCLLIAFTLIFFSCAPTTQLPRSSAPLNIHFPGTIPLRLIDTTVDLAVVLVDFADSRLKNGSLPTSDADTAYFPGESINPVGSMGWEMDNRGILQKKIRKYHYEDYWNKYFWLKPCLFDCRETYDSPDHESHGTEAFGSVRSYYHEVSYGNLRLNPPQTHPGPVDRYHTGIVNQIDSSAAGKFVRWIMLPGKKSDYMAEKVGIITPALRALDSLHRLPSDNPNHLWFNPTGFKGRYAIVGAGSNIGGATFYFNNAFATSEKAYYVPNQFPESKLDGVLQPVHELAHTFGLEHIVIGSFDPMHWGALTPLAQECPPHFNPLTKYMLGWLKPSDILVLDSSATNVALRPSTDPPDGIIPSAVFIRIHPVHKQEGPKHKSDPAEYLIIEYRTRTGFNALTGGSTILPRNTESLTNGSAGGALIWHYDEAAGFPYPSSYQITGYMSLEVPGYGPSYPKAKDQSLTDYIALGQTFQLPPSHVFSTGGRGEKSPLEITNVHLRNNNLVFDVRFH